MASFIFKNNPILYLAEKDKLVYINEIDFLKEVNIALYLEIYKLYI